VVIPLLHLVRPHPSPGNPDQHGLRATLARDTLRSLHPHALETITVRRVVEQLLLSPELRLVVAFRLYSWLAEHVRWSLAHCVYMYIRGRTGCDLALGAVIGPGLRIEHRSDIVIGMSAVLGSDIDVYNGVTVGKRRPPSDEMPTIGDRVMLAAGAKLLGNITIGDDVVVAANAVVLDDVEAGATVAGVPARPVGHARPSQLGRSRSNA
jgi:serine O-acetyltransferase